MKTKTKKMTGSACNTPATQTSPSTAASSESIGNTRLLQNALAAELAAEMEFRSVALCLDIDGLMPGQFGYRNFVKRYNDFASTCPTPNLLTEAHDFACAFIAAQGYSDEKAQAAVIYVIWRIWNDKAETGNILRPDVKAEWIEREKARADRVNLHVAINRICKGKSEDSFEAGLRVNVLQMLVQAGANALAGLAAPRSGVLL
jgi:hypothetical protein